MSPSMPLPLGRAVDPARREVWKLQEPEKSGSPSRPSLTGLILDNPAQAERSSTSVVHASTDAPTRLAEAVRILEVPGRKWPFPLALVAGSLDSRCPVPTGNFRLVPIVPDSKGMREVTARGCLHGSDGGMHLGLYIGRIDPSPMEGPGSQSDGSCLDAAGRARVAGQHSVCEGRLRHSQDNPGHVRPVKPLVNNRQYRGTGVGQLRTFDHDLL